MNIVTCNISCSMNNLLFICIKLIFEFLLNWTGYIFMQCLHPIIDDPSATPACDVLNAFYISLTIWF